MKKVYAVKLNFSNNALFTEIIERIRRALPVDVEELSLAIDLSPFYSEERGQHLSPGIIGGAAELTGGIEGKVLLFTDLDIYIPALTFVFGQAQLNGRHSLISVCRLHEEFYTGRTDSGLLLGRAAKEALHELGHNYGLIHCNNWDCVMHSSLNVEQVDIKGSAYCPLCLSEIMEKL
jgi:archaemetzincin